MRAIGVVLLLSACTDGPTIDDETRIVMDVDCADPDVQAALDGGHGYDTGLVVESGGTVYGVWNTSPSGDRGFAIVNSDGPLVLDCRDSAPSPYTVVAL